MNDAEWSGEGQFGASSEPQDFDHLLDLDNFDLGFDFGAAHGTNPSPQLGQLAEELDLQHLHSTYSPAVSSQDHGNGSTSAQQQQQQQHYFDFSMPPYSQNAPAFTHSQDQMYRHQGPVPPTPNSIEMHADQAHYMQHMDAQQAMFEQRYPMRKDDMTFTPLVSPAVTPHESRFRVPDMTTVPGAYFSPLTSPALKGQNPPQSHPHYPTTSGSSAAASPIDVDQDMLGEPAVSQEEPGRKLRSNKRSAPRSAAPARIRQSPIVKPGRRKATVSQLIPPKEVTNLMEEARGNRYSGGIDVRMSRDSSETDSISPEPLSEMGPPPKPSSVTPSPAMLAQNHPSASGVTPATPASLMRIQPSPTFSVPEALPTLDDLTLPEASLERPPLSRLDTAIQDDGLDTPRLSARKTPKLSAEGTPSTLYAMNGKASPMLSGNSTPTSPAFAPYARRDSKSGGRSIKKRGSMTSALVSPALRPKISPSIKPLLPGGSNGVSSDTHTLLLASKSNYQNILDGTTVPGVVYPTSLSNNLTSKRTSHKMAEQGRRNRINTALQEMQALLPSPHLSGKESKSPEPGGPQSNSSKAAKVESAIEYIKQLQQQCFDKDRLLDRKDQEMEALRKEVAALRASTSPGTNAATSTEAKTTSSSPAAETTENDT